jgi:hypothetical protein
MSRSASLWFKCTTIGCERAQEALLQLVQASLVRRRVKQTQHGYLCKHIGPMLGERPIGGLTAEALDAARRAGGDRSRIGGSERNVRLAGSAETRATGVVAAA